jgi:hypothetical protein
LFHPSEGATRSLLHQRPSAAAQGRVTSQGERRRELTSEDEPDDLHGPGRPDVAGGDEGDAP